MFFGIGTCYEEYYAFGESIEEVKQLLWRMYCNNCYNRPTKEDKETFFEEMHIEEFNPKSGKAYGFNTGYRELYHMSGNKLTRIKTTTKEA